MFIPTNFSNFFIKSDSIQDGIYFFGGKNAKGEL